MSRILAISILLFAAFLTTRRENLLVGGLGDDLSEDDVDADEFNMGLSVEMEHTKDKRIAREIALDHLAEEPKYYTKLERIHKENPQKVAKKAKKKARKRKK